jgi:hypothetical protein
MVGWISYGFVLVIPKKKSWFWRYAESIYVYKSIQSLVKTTPYLNILTKRKKKLLQQFAKKAHRKLSNILFNS